MTNQPNGTLYVGATTDLARRVWEHRNNFADSFTKKYRLHRLVYAEKHDDILAAKQREMNIKHWSRSWKVQLILKANPNGMIFTIPCCKGVGGRVKPGHGRIRQHFNLDCL